MQQQIVCHKCRCPNKFGTVFCRNCGTKLKVQDLHHPDRARVIKIKRAFVKLVKLLVILAIVALLAALFLPYGMAKYPAVTGEKEIASVQKICENIDKSLAKKSDGFMVSFNPAELTCAVNYLLDPQRPPVKVDAVVTPNSIRSFSGGAKSLGGNNSLGSGGNLGQGRDLSSNSGSMTQGNTPSSTKKEKKREPSTEEKEEIDQLTVDFAFDITKDLDLRIVITGVMLEVFLYRFEIIGTPGTYRDENDPASKEKLTFDVKSAKYGHLPLPMLVKEHVIALFREIAFSKENVESYLKCVKTIDIKAEDHIEIILGK